MTSSPFGASILRGLLAASVTFGVTIFATVQSAPLLTGGGRDWETSAIAAGAASFAVLLTRIGGEGSFDQVRDSTKPASTVPSDVGVKA